MNDVMHKIVLGLSSVYPPYLKTFGKFFSEPA